MLRMIKIAFLMSLLVGCGAPTQADKPTDKADKYVTTYGGNHDTYAEILSITDCKELQGKFDTASANNAREQAGTKQFKVTLGYMMAADDRMKEVGCYK